MITNIEGGYNCVVRSDIVFSFLCVFLCGVTRLHQYHVPFYEHNIIKGNESAGFEQKTKLPRPLPRKLEGALGTESISPVALSIFVSQTTAGPRGNQQSALRGQIPLGTSAFPHPSSKATGYCYGWCALHNSRGSQSHSPQREQRPLELQYLVALTSCQFPRSQLPFILHGSAQVFSSL